MSRFPERLAVIGYSNISTRIAQLAAGSGIPTIYFVAEAELSLVKTPGYRFELHPMPANSHAEFPAVISSCSAFIIASDNEQFNILTTLQLADWVAGRRIVTRLFNIRLGQEIERRLPNVKVLSVSELAAPHFAASAFIDGVMAAWRQEERLLVKTTAGGPDTVHDLDVLLREQPCGGKGECRPSLYRKRIRLDRMFLAVLAALGMVMISGTIYFWLARGLPPGDALYFVVTTLTTTGYGDYSLRESPIFAKIVGMGLMLSGATLLAILFALVTDVLLRIRLDTTLGRRPVDNTGHIIVCGAGDVGVRIIECLQAAGASPVAVERDQDRRFNQRIRDLGIPLVIADAALEETLEKAGAPRASAIICATDNDMGNLEIALNARALNPGIRQVVRIYDPEFSEQMHNHFGIAAVISSSAIAAPRFLAAALSAETDVSVTGWKTL